MEKRLTEPVSLSIQTPRAKAVRPFPRTENIWPVHMMKKVRMGLFNLKHHWVKFKSERQSNFKNQTEKLAVIVAYRLIADADKICRTWYRHIKESEFCWCRLHAEYRNG